jgi:hypothetical protein
MIRSQLRAVLEDSTRGDVIAEAKGDNVRSAVAALFDEQPASIEWLMQFHPEVVGLDIEVTLESPEARAVRILRDNEMEPRLHHTGGGIWVAEVRSSTIPGRTVWISDSEGDQDGPFLVGVYPDSECQESIEPLSGALSADDLVACVERGLTQSVNEP